jgi:CheY-like chemotaxis protein
MGKHLLFIDDDSAFLYLLERTCKRIEEVSKVSCASNGKNALDFLDEHLTTGQDLPHIAFVDINMPVMDGFEFLEHFKQRRDQFLKLKEIIPIVMLTSSNENKDKEKAFSTGIVDQYIIKPSDIKEMENIIREIST